MKTKSLRDFPTAQEKRKFLEEKLKISLEKISQTHIEQSMVEGRNIENFIGATQIPLGVAGPLKIIHHKSLIINHFIPLATTEGALVASVSRGCKAVTESGGAKAFVENVGISRGPVFKTKGIEDGIKIKSWISKNFAKLGKVTQSTSSHLKLLKIESQILGKNLFVRFSFDTTDAMGMNMATIATQQAVELIEQQTKCKCISVAGNFDIDKKPAWLNFINGRGKKVWAEAIISKQIVKTVLKTTSQDLSDLVYRKAQLGSIMSGSMGFNAHFANIIAAIFASTGQDLAHVAEGSLGVTTAEVLENEDLYFSVYLPSLEVGTVGGGTHLPTQQEALNLMKVANVLEYSQLLASAVLAGELSLMASQTEGSLTKAHQKLGRKK